MTTAGNRPSIDMATRCPACGRRSVVAGLCASCGAGETQRQDIIPAPAHPLAEVPQISEVFPPAVQPAAVPDRLRPTPESSLQQCQFGPAARGIRGRVIIVRQGPTEPMDFDPWRWVAMPVWGVILLISPLALAILVWQSFGFLPAAAVALCGLLGLRYIFSDRLLQSWQLTAALNGRDIVEPMPVLLIRLRLEDEREVQVRLKGQLIGGTLIEGDRIAAFGPWRFGVLHARSIACERTGATIIPRQPCARGLALTGLCVLAAVALWLHLAGFPFASEQVRSFRSTIPRQALPCHNVSFSP